MKLKRNVEKFHFMLYGENSNDHSVTLGPTLVKEGTEEKPLGVTFDKKLSFETHVRQLCTRAS